MIHLFLKTQISAHSNHSAFLICKCLKRKDTRGKHRQSRAINYTQAMPSGFDTFLNCIPDLLLGRYLYPLAYRKKRDFYSNKTCANLRPETQNLGGGRPGGEHLYNRTSSQNGGTVRVCPPPIPGAPLHPGGGGPGCSTAPLRAERGGCGESARGSGGKHPSVLFLLIN